MTSVIDERMFFAQGVLVPYPNLAVSAMCVATPQLWVCRMNAITLLSHLRVGWINEDDRPYVRAWAGHAPALALALSVLSREIMRRMNDGRVLHQPFWIDGSRNDQHEVVPLPAHASEVVLPSWFGNDEVHATHRAFINGSVERGGIRWL